MTGNEYNWYAALMCVVGMIKEWQTLVAGILALIAAYLTVRAIKQQIKLQQDQFDKIQTRKRWMTRATLSDALAGVTSYCQSVVKIINAPRAMPIDRPSTEIDVLKAAIEHSNHHAAERIYQLTNKYQIQIARLEGFLNTRSADCPRTHDIPMLMLNVAELQALTNSLFDYARNKSDDGPVTALTNLDVHTGLTNVTGLAEIDNFDDTRELIDQFFQQTSST